MNKNVEEKLRDITQFGAEIEVHDGEHFAIWAPAINGQMVKAEEYFALLNLLEAERQQAEDIRASFDELAGVVGFSKERCDQTGDSPMDCARQLCQRADDAERANRNQYRDLAAGQELQKQLVAEIAALKGDQVPVTMDALRDAVAEMSGGLPIEWHECNDKGHRAVPFINFNSLHRIVTKFTAPQKSVVRLNSSAVMSRSYVVKRIEAAGCTVEGFASKKVSLL